MQASKIIPGEVYAVKRNSVLLRFRVEEVVTVTRRKGVKANPHEHTSNIVGFFVDKISLVGEDDPVRRQTLAPDELLGEYTAYAELVERNRLEKETHEAKNKAEKKAAIALATKLCQLAGLPVPEKWDGYSDTPIRVSYNGVEIKVEAVAPLLEALKKIEVMA